LRDRVNACSGLTSSRFTVHEKPIEDVIDAYVTNPLDTVTFLEYGSSLEA
jgi:hypothetical protein